MICDRCPSFSVLIRALTRGLIGSFLWCLPAPALQLKNAEADTLHIYNLITSALNCLKDSRGAYGSTWFMQTYISSDLLVLQQIKVIVALRKDKKTWACKGGFCKEESLLYYHILFIMIEESVEF